MANGVILWQGISRIDRKTPVVCILVGTARGSSNRKTGDMLQTYIIRSDMHPIDAVQTFQDRGLCGGCPHARNRKTGKRSCYVNMGQGPRSVYVAYRAGTYPVAKLSQLADVVGGRAVRFGTYGDPAAVPLAVWRALSEAAEGRTTGYTHQWRSDKFAGLADYCQASCETLADVEQARSLGYRGAFLVVPQGADIPDGAVHCPASAERGKVATCATCLACNGRGGALVAIHAHGAGAVNYQPAARQPARRTLPVLA